jgi:hypothetical protein
MDFDSTKRIIYRRDDGLARNILNAANYEGGLVEGDWFFQYNYTITDDDYANALPIE